MTTRKESLEDTTFHIQKSLEDLDELGDDALTVKEVTTPCNLNTSIGEHFDRLGTVRVMVGECHLVVKCSGFQCPFKTIGVRSLASHLVGTDPLESASESLYVNHLHKARDHSDRRNLYP
jgi:hypothetical protein